MARRYCKKCKEDTERVQCDDRCKPCNDRRRTLWLIKDRVCATPLCSGLAFQKGTYCRRCSYESNLRTRYGVTLEEYAWLAYNQQFCCAICSRKLDFSTKRGAVLDHCHTTNKVRGLLHSSCNTAIGLFDEDPVTIDKAATYLRNWTEN